MYWAHARRQRDWQLARRENLNFPELEEALEAVDRLRADAAARRSEAPDAGGRWLLDDGIKKLDAARSQLDEAIESVRRMRGNYQSATAGVLTVAGLKAAAPEGPTGQHFLSQVDAIEARLSGATAASEAVRAALAEAGRPDEGREAMAELTAIHARLTSAFAGLGALERDNLKPDVDVVFEQCARSAARLSSGGPDAAAPAARAALVGQLKAAVAEFRSIEAQLASSLGEVERHDGLEGSIERLRRTSGVVNAARERTREILG